jgi:YbgC/YbaW family acyl-CoA thioester hydrolase
MTRGRTGTVTTRVRFGETDAAGIVFYPTFYAWFDMGATALVRGASPDGVHDDDGRPRWPIPIVEAGASFLAPLYFDDAIAIETTVVDVGARSFRLEHVVLRGDDEVARGYEVRVHVRRESGRYVSAPLPEELRAFFTTATETSKEVDDRAVTP